MANETFTFSHTLEEINQILAALSERPFKEVVVLMGKIHAEVQKQYSPPPEVSKLTSQQLAEAAKQATLVQGQLIR